MEKEKLFLFADGMILYIESPSIPIPNVIELINIFARLQDTRSTHKNQSCSCTVAANNLKLKF